MTSNIRFIATLHFNIKFEAAIISVFPSSHKYLLVRIVYKHSQGKCFITILYKSSSFVLNLKDFHGFKVHAPSFGPTLLSSVYTRLFKVIYFPLHIFCNPCLPSIGKNHLYLDDKTAWFYDSLPELIRMLVSSNRNLYFFYW